LTSIRQQLLWASGLFNAISGSARLDSEVLLAHCLQKDRSYLMTWPQKDLTGEQMDCFRDLVQRRLQPQPVAYLVGYREFYSLSLITTVDTLVPRPETELLVDTVLELTRDNPGLEILDLGTGTGAIALAIKKHARSCRVSATDYLEETLKIARRNAKNLSLEVQFIQSDWYQALASDSVYDIIVSNPPYIAADDPCLQQGDLPAEPMQALCSGESGLEAVQTIISGAGSRLKNAGMLVLEHGFEQALAVRQLMARHGFENIRTELDFSGLERMTMGRKPDNNTKKIVEI
jgi:release factor glutamine methyltransferase